MRVSTLVRSRFTKIQLHDKPKKSLIKYVVCEMGKKHKIAKMEQGNTPIKKESTTQRLLLY